MQGLYSLGTVSKQVLNIGDQQKPNTAPSLGRET